MHALALALSSLCHPPSRPIPRGFVAGRVSGLRNPVHLCSARAKENCLRTFLQLAGPIPLWKEKG
eukprot:10150997-Alexandrium_andersonii.AAC.1